MQLIIDTANTKISVRNKSFHIQNNDYSKIIAPKRISSIAVTTNCNINAAVIKLAAQHQIPVYFYNNFGTLQARMCSPFLVNLAELRRKQLYFYHTKEATQWVIDILNHKTNLQISLLKQLKSRKPKHRQFTDTTIEQMKILKNKAYKFSAKKIDEVRNNLLGIEGQISKNYFKNLSLFLPQNFQFNTRSRRPATDYFNAGLNYLYGMTYSIVESGIYAKGLDPYAGFMHTDYYKKPSLVFDLIEPVRPLVDKIWLQLILNNKIKENHFIKKEQGFWLNKQGKRVVIPAYNQFLYKRFKLNENYFSLKKFIYTLSNDLGKLIEITLK